MAEKLIFLIPEMILFLGAVSVAVIGLSPSKKLREALPAMTAVFLAAAGITVPFIYTAERVAGAEGIFLMPGIGSYVKIIVCVVGIVLTMLSAGMVDRRLESDVSAGRMRFDPIRASRGEYHAFFLLSLIGVMLTVSATDLIWLFVALELTSLPTYIMVAISRPARRAQEASMKYFFLGALSSAVFLYGFALIYGETGTLVLTEIAEVFGGQKHATGGSIGAIGTVGMILAILGISYKIAAAPMHFYAADVYEGAASPVTAFLGFVPKTAGMIALILLLGTVGWGDELNPGLPQPILTMLWMMAVLTMTLGNIGALLQRSVKRMLAYSSIAHSGYLMIGLIAGTSSGIDAILFYLLAYGLMNTGAFAVLSGLERKGQEIESLDDLAGLRERHPAMAWAMALCAGSLLGFPPLLGFIGKLYLFIAGVQSGQIALVVIAGLNSAISAWYYLRLIGMPILSGPTARSETVERSPFVWPRVAALGTAIAVVVLPIFAQRLMEAAQSGPRPEPAATSVSRRLLRRRCVRVGLRARQRTLRSRRRTVPCGQVGGADSCRLGLHAALSRGPRPLLQHERRGSGARIQALSQDEERCRAAPAGVLQCAHSADGLSRGPARL